MTQVTTFDCSVIDQFGKIDNAFVAIYGVCANAIRKAEATNIRSEYDLSNNVEAITYHANYWYTRQAEADGYPSQQVKEEEELSPEVKDAEGNITQKREFRVTEVLTVDLSHPDVVNILASNMQPLECDLACAASDVIRRGK